MKKLFHAKLANLDAAKMCNHKRTIPKNFEASLQKKRDTLKTAEKTKPWKATEELLKKAESKTVKTEKLKEKQKHCRFARFDKALPTYRFVLLVSLLITCVFWS